MRVRDFALRQLHPAIRRDAWVRALFLASGGPLDEEAGELLEAWNYNDFGNLSNAQCSYYEKLLGIKPSEVGETLEDRRAVIEAKWRSAELPTVKMLISIVESFGKGDIQFSYDPTNAIVTLKFTGEIGIPEGVDGLKRALEQVIPAHIMVDYAYRHYTIAELNGLAISELNKSQISKFAGG